MRAILSLIILCVVFLSGCGSLNQQLITAAENYQSAKAADTREVSKDALRRLPDGTYVPFWDAEQQARRANTDDDFQRAIMAAKTGK